MKTNDLAETSEMFPWAKDAPCFQCLHPLLFVCNNRKKHEPKIRKIWRLIPNTKGSLWPQAGYLTSPCHGFIIFNMTKRHLFFFQNGRPKIMNQSMQIKHSEPFRKDSLTVRQDIGRMPFSSVEPFLLRRLLVVRFWNLSWCIPSCLSCTTS